jgi:hypothetical protein
MQVSYTRFFLDMARDKFVLNIAYSLLLTDVVIHLLTAIEEWFAILF